jgi:PIN domain nuclease of toxin-antitoxin system
MQKSRTVFPVKTAYYLADITGYSLRSCEYWLSEKSVIPADALTALLHSEWGREYLSAVMSDATPRWWLQLKAWIASVDLAAAEMKQRRKLRELLDVTAQANSHPSSSFVSDPDFHSSQPYPHRTLAKRKR